jgi:hypothetical protein
VPKRKPYDSMATIARHPTRINGLVSTFALRHLYAALSTGSVLDPLVARPLLESLEAWRRGCGKVTLDEAFGFAGLSPGQHPLEQLALERRRDSYLAELARLFAIGVTRERAVQAVTALMKNSTPWRQEWPSLDHVEEATVNDWRKTFEVPPAKRGARPVLRFFEREAAEAAAWAPEERREYLRKFPDAERLFSRFLRPEK